MRKMLLASVLASVVALPASAANIITFAQVGNANQVTATTNGGNTATTLSISSAAVAIGQFLAPIPATSFLSLTATSVDAVTTVAGALLQHYSGNFCITTGAGCGGTNLLSGTFTDAAFGASGGPGLVVNVNNPPDSLSLTSSVIPAGELTPPNTFSLGFSNIPAPGLGIAGTTIAAFTASFAGVASATATPVAEPAGLAVLGAGLIGLGMVRFRGRKDLT